MSTLQEQIAITKPFAEFTFSLANLADTQTDTTIPALTGIDTHVMWKSGMIVGATIQLSETWTAGVLTLEVEVAGADNGIDIPLITATTTEYEATYEFGDYPFAEGATLGLTYTSDASFTPITMDIMVTLIVMYVDARV